MRCFDFCFTLVNVNTTYSFVDYCVSKSGLYLKVKLFFIKIISKLLLKFNIINFSRHSKLRISVLNGLKLTELNKFSREFALVLNNNINDNIYKELISDDPENVIIISNSLQFVIQDFLDFKGLKVTVIGSNLLINGSNVLGKYDLYVPDKGKVKVLLESYPNITIDEFFTDDFDADYDLVEYSNVSRLVDKGIVIL
ncbi:HAD family hydrolase [Photobacterium leiognathi]|uniref:hypothetical protein n=1 Tax=Photobacterium leiognathi TaxID=553611 RepID=UPI00298174CD|nr:hypothetical protein [Photobacterium leiognathi]